MPVSVPFLCLTNALLLCMPSAAKAQERDEMPATDRHDAAVAAAERGDPRQAAAELRWCLLRGESAEPGYFSRRGGDLIRDLRALLPQVHGLADEIDRDAEALCTSVLARGLRREQVLPLVACGRVLDRDQRTANVYELLLARPEANDAAALQTLFVNVRDTLWSLRRYRTLLRARPDPVRWFGDRADAWGEVERRLRGKAVQPSPRARAALVGEGLIYVEALFGVGRREPAVALIDRVLAFDARESTVDGLIAAATRAGDNEAARALRRAVGRSRGEVGAAEAAARPPATGPENGVRRADR